MTDVLTDYVRYGSMQVITCGKIAVLKANINFSTEVSPYTTLGTLPDALKPAASFMFGMTPTNASDTSATYFEVDTSGQLICYKSPTVNGFYNINIPYFLQ